MDAQRRAGVVVALTMVLAATFGIGSAPSALADPGSPSGWSIQPLPTPAVAANGHLSAVSCVSNTSCWAVGYSHDGAGVDVSLAEQWNGTRWTIWPTPNPDRAQNSFLTGVSCTSATFCSAVGDVVDASGKQLVLAEHWNGTRWVLEPSPSPAGATESFLTSVSCISPAACSAVGYSRRGGGENATVAERWNGATWQLQPSPNAGGGTSSRLSSVSCTSASACTAVGFSGDMFATPQAVVERWNGTTWALQSAPQPPGATKSVLSSVSCPTAIQCIAVGYWHDSAKGGGTLAERWDGTAWVVQPTPGGVSDVYNSVSCAGADACLVVGKSGLADFVAARWQGGDWTSTAAPPSGTLADSNYVGLSCVTLTACVTVGASETAQFDFTYLTSTAGWNGTSWTTQQTANSSGATTNELVAVSCATEGSCVAVGFSWKRPDASEPLVEHWNGTEWTVDSTPPVPDSTLSAVSCSAVDDCLAVGSSVDATGAPAPLAEHWNGRSWQVQPTPVPAGARAAGFSGVSCLPSTRDDRTGHVSSTAAQAGCVAVGAYADASGIETVLVERSSGSTWQIQPAPTPTGTAASALSAVSCGSATDCTAIGSFQTQSATPFGPPGPCDFSCILAEHWNGTTWQAGLPPMPQSSIGSSLTSVSCVSSGACSAVGDWTPQDRAGGHPGITLAEYWNGSSWAIQPTPDPPGVGGANGTNNSPFEAVSCADRGCTAVGNYDSGNAGGQFLPLAEHTNGSGWSVQTVPAPLGTYYNDLRGVSCPTTHMCMAVGMSYRSNTANLSDGPHVALAVSYRRP